MYDLLIVNVHRQYDALPYLAGDWLGIYQLSAFLEENGYPAKAFAGYAHEADDLLENEIDSGVKIIGFSCDYENQQEVIQLCRKVKDQWGLPVIVGGPQAVALGEDFLIKSCADAIVRGEGELAALELMHFFIDRTGKIEDILGITFLKDGICVNNPDQPLIKNLDSLPFPKPHHNIGTWFRRNSAAFITGRGCPFNCSFCYEGGNMRGVRWRSIENVMTELKEVLDSRPDIKYVLFTDDTFTLNHRRLRSFVEALSDYRKKRDFGWFAEAHVMTLLRHPELVSEMVEAGLLTLQIGVESGNDSVLKAYNKKISTKDIEDAVILCKNSGVPHVVANIIVGGALETEKTIKESISFGKSIIEAGAGMMELHAINFWPLPGTAMTKRPHDFGIEILDPDSLTSTTDYPVVRCDTLEPEHLCEYRLRMEGKFKKKMEVTASQLSFDRALMHFQMAYKYNSPTQWYYILNKIDRYRMYCSLYINGAIRKYEQIPEKDRPLWRPIRTCPPNIKNGFNYAGDIEVDSEQFSVLLSGTGKMTILEASEYCKLSMEKFIEIALTLESFMAMGFCRY
ncbi:radical SAM superfamily enzyme YgiQ (UPF0313 family) [Desulfobotulus alkaliphilus]|uniref:Radical SAM superfamily enzyme YgiQ (UPF0313 family) n=2 Tax=Desulfobotulus alkaliphilus TaxID=622671 RepID=A0A562R7H3_9BACT|nr:radical SAM superfamily enzyme YgiQ (UPF0313 family) [Desulfobotulus alkaliphilus]